MRKALVFVTAFALVLVAGVAVAFMATPGADGAAGEAFEEPVVPDTLEKEKQEPPAEEEVTEEKRDESRLIEEEKREEDPPKVEEEKREEEVEEEEIKEEDDTTPPDLVILFPEDGQRFDRKEIAFEGKTDPTARVFAGDYEADVDDEGNWRIILFLRDGGNTTTITAIGEAGNKATAQVQAFYDAPKEVEEPEEEEEPKEESKEFDFSANQKYGSCAEDVPYDEWNGTGTPGTEIWIGNDWGSATTTIGDNGEWFLKVTFPDMPCDTQTVFLETNDGDRKVYEFTRVCNEGADQEK